MKYIFILVFAFAAQTSAVQATERPGYTKQSDKAQYKGSDYSNVVHVERAISLEEAFEIAESNPEIDYFVYMKGGQMVLEIPPGVPFDPENDPFGLVIQTRFTYDSGEPSYGYCRIFRYGDTVFFKNEGKWLGSAPGYADAYFKVK